MARIARSLVIITILAAVATRVYAPMPLIPAGGLNMGAAMAGMSGLADFVGKIKSAVGKPSEFVDRNNFEYGHIYNALLQYSVIQAFEQSQTNTLLGRSSGEVEKVYNEVAKLFYAQVATAILLTVNIIMMMKVTGHSLQADQNVNVVRA